MGLSTVSLLAQTPLPPLPGGTPGADETEFYSEDDAEALNRGAIHEAFATPVDNEPVVGLVVNRQPPEPIDEVPPDLKPEGENIVWISGYFSFDEELDDFVWISGMWRDVPPGRAWAPGYWHEIEGGWQWVHGYWAEEAAEEITYLPEPPATQEYGSSSPSPGDNHFYIPGSWVYVNYNYSWRPGYWAPFQPNWVWIPARYIFTPRGYVYIPGYWDYLLGYRGVAYAPVHFHRYGLGRRFRPVVLIDSWDHLILHLFVRPRFGCYAFGNYYGDRYNNFYRPWYAHHRLRGGYDPLYAHFHIRYGDVGYNRLVGWNSYFQTHSEFRPRNTYREQRDFFVANRDNRVVAATSLARNYDQIRDNPKTRVSFRTLEVSERTAITKSIQDVRKASLERTQFEGRTKGFGNAKIQKAETQKFEIPKLVQQQRVPGVSDRVSNRKGPGSATGKPDVTDRKPPELPEILGNRGQGGRTRPGTGDSTLPAERNRPATGGSRVIDPKTPSTQAPGATQSNPRVPRGKDDTDPEPGVNTPVPNTRPTPGKPNNPKAEPPNRTLPATRTPGKPDIQDTPRTPRVEPPKQTPPSTRTPIKPDTQDTPRTSNDPNAGPPIRTLPATRTPGKPDIKDSPRTPNAPRVEPPKQLPPSTLTPRKPDLKDSPRTPSVPKIESPRQTPPSVRTPGKPDTRFTPRTPSTPQVEAPKQSIPKPRSEPKAPAFKPPERNPSSNSSSASQNRTPPVQRSSKPSIQSPAKSPSGPPPRAAKSLAPPNRSTSRESTPPRSSFSKPSAPRQAPQTKQATPPKRSSGNTNRGNSSSQSSFSKSSPPRQAPQIEQSTPPQSSSKSSKTLSTSRKSIQRSKQKD
ncbi:MAG TPA: hypothetical protein VMM56_02565 [Planctomycetaceae bacterium]|nr:hypothetical protein [Planctomycetaceae bacterium]